MAIIQSNSREILNLFTCFIEDIVCVDPGDELHIFLVYLYTKSSESPLCSIYLGESFQD